MQTEQIRVCCQNRKIDYPIGVTYAEIAADFSDLYEHAIILAFVDGKLCELFKKPMRDCTISFVTTGDTNGHKTYERSVTFLLAKACYDVLEGETSRLVYVRHSISKGLYCELDEAITVSEELLYRIENRMKELVEADLPIRKMSRPTDETIDRFRKYGMFDKEKIFRFRQSSSVNIYELDGFHDYFYGYMAFSTGVLKYFSLFAYDKGFVLQIPETRKPDEVPPFAPQNKLFHVLRQTEEWNRLMHIQTVGDLNEELVNGRGGELILVQEALQEKKIGDIAEDITKMPDKKFILIAGPSSSGKTSFANRLSIQLRAHGFRPHKISVDDYFVNRDRTPRDENGNFDFESIHAIDLEQFNSHLEALLRGEKIEMPSYNFNLGKQEYLGNYLQMNENDILVIEGIHCLNDELTSHLDAKYKYKIYISALTTLNIDEHNRIPTTDGRLLRRMTRDARTRGISAQETIRMWPSVRRGEEQNIFPFQEEADCMFNSALIYELAVLKPYCTPLLYGIPKDAEEYAEAKRLLKFLDYFLPFGSDHLPNNSLVREFVGGSCFHV